MELDYTTTVVQNIKMDCDTLTEDAAKTQENIRSLANMGYILYRVVVLEYNLVMHYYAKPVAPIYAEAE